MITWSVNDAGVIDMVEELAWKADHLPLDAIGEIMVESVHTTMDSEGRPDAWEPPARDYGHPLLYDTGELYNSIEYSVGKDEVAVDSPLDYAKFQDEGTSTIPSRPFLLLQNEDYETIDNLLIDWFSD